ncbi:Cutinase palindrome-binding protein [Cordyceps fumosorosea ARSEF 2679]|uniref:Cutinase palindrome-binding protein n=1 Tax=Cordyceps fumosorosea (strain ARSEF 2679) TaxID=1081104 RepID=A0A167V078_CORFA|nr:Cutinase palindrome-binding protein [Cordyceps fumosorosea ARSEF 2679]OAA62085.1 Cutinase palindrome-binding protein [Cordyceps fumosorosea ARSEF 2679]
MSQGHPPPPNGYAAFQNMNLHFLPDASASQHPVIMSSAPVGPEDPGAFDSDEAMRFADAQLFGEFTSDLGMGAFGSADPSLGDAFNPDFALESMMGNGHANPVNPPAAAGTGPENMPREDPTPVDGPPQPMQLTNPGTSTLNEFTKRRNWPAKIVEELRDWLQILDANGRLKFVSRSVADLAGYAEDDLRDVFLKDMIHPDDQGVFVSELNESIASGNPLRIFYRFKKKDGRYTIFEAVGHAHIAAAKFAPNPSNQSPFCQAVFMVARPYPTRNAALLDSFLEHKIENERLKRRIAELQREEQADADESRQQLSQTMSQSAPGSNMAPSEFTGPSSTPLHLPGNGDTPMSGTSDGHAIFNGALTRENLEGASVAGRRDSLRDKMARYEGASHIETIEMLTGLRYVEGERSHGITTGNTSPALIKGDAGIAIPKDRDGRLGEKKKKLKVSEEYVCTDCGTLDSPEWRKGPSGPKTLCNACGLRWAKKEKKRSRMHGGSQAALSTDLGPPS